MILEKQGEPLQASQNPLLFPWPDAIAAARGGLWALPDRSARGRRRSEKSRASPDPWAPDRSVSSTAWVRPSKAFASVSGLVFRGWAEPAANVDFAEANKRTSAIARAIPATSSTEIRRVLRGRCAILSARPRGSRGHRNRAMAVRRPHRLSNATHRWRCPAPRLLRIRSRGPHLLIQNRTAPGAQRLRLHTRVRSGQPEFRPAGWGQLGRCLGRIGLPSSSTRRHLRSPRRFWFRLRSRRCEKAAPWSAPEFT